jgi:hypothetical protein
MDRKEALARVRARHGERSTVWRRGGWYYAGFRFVRGMRHGYTRTTWYWIAKSYDDLVRKAEASQLTCDPTK